MINHRDWVKVSDEYLIHKAFDIEGALLHCMPAMTQTLLVADGTHLLAFNLAWRGDIKKFETEAYLMHEDKLIVIKTRGCCAAEALSLLDCAVGKLELGYQLPSMPSKDGVLPIYHFGEAPHAIDRETPF